VFASLQGYQRLWIRADVVAGLTVWAVLVPEALAYATIAGVPPVVGLYAAIPSLVLYAVAGSSRHLVVGPMSATAALSAASAAPFAGGDQTQSSRSPRRWPWSPASWACSPGCSGSASSPRSSPSRC
jgi:SulP family sulfate permease